MRRPAKLLTVGVLAVTLAAMGCTRNTGQDVEGEQQEASTQTAVLAENSDGPAPAVPGAKEGGTVTIYTSGDFEHLDPQQIYVVPAQTTATNLLTRSLTQFRENGDGKLEVVGDLATNTGEESNGGKTWKYTLKDGLKYEDGSAITAQDVAYGIARSFSPDLTEGPKWIQQWLVGSGSYNEKYKGPYNGGAKIPPNVQVPDAKKRILTGPTQFVWMFDFNLQRVKDINVRKAFNYALDREGLLKVWGSYSGDPSSTILSPTTSGYDDFNLYDGGKNGDPAKAMELLGGKRMPLVYAYRNTERNQAVAAFLRSSLKEAGFDLNIQPVDEDQYYTVLGRKDNQFDVYMQGWGADWPGGGTIIPALFDGRVITATGNQNITYLNDEQVNKEMDAILGLSDLAEADKRWAALDKDIMSRIVPIAPAIYDKQTTMYGSKIGGIYLSAPFGNSGLNNLYVK